MKPVTVVLAFCLLHQAKGVLKIFVENKPGGFIQCAGGQVLKINKASFGDGVKCHARNSLSEVQRRCEGFPSCFLEARNTIFGEPCRGKGKKLFLDYICIRPGEFDIRAVAICSGKARRIQCPARSPIIILGANFGRMNSGQCVAGNYKQETCMSRRSGLVYRQCNGKQTCVLASSIRYFGNPCPTAAPYLEVKYRCRPPLRRVVICENKARRITCDNPQFRLRIYRAQYGRTNTRLCRGPNDVNYRCFGNPGLVTSKLRLRCQGQNSCYLWASNLLYGDPCRTTYKYLAVTYSCF